MPITSINPLTSHPPQTDSEVSPQQAKLRETCREFEALLVQSMFKSMRNSVPDGGLLEKDKSEEMFQDQIDIAAARSFARRPGLGIAESLYRHLAPKPQGHGDPR